MADSGNDPLTLGSLEWETELDTVATDIASDPSTPTTALGPTESSTKAPPAKRARTTASGSKANNAQKKNTGLSKRKKGRLNILPTLPLDLLFEIFGHLTPADLVPLSRVSKSFYKVLSSRSSVSLWKRTWRNVPGGPPPQRPEGCISKPPNLVWARFKWFREFGRVWACFILARDLRGLQMAWKLAKQT